MSSSCIASLTGNPNGSMDTESNLSLATMGDEDMNSPTSMGSEREYRLALWVTKRWRFHQMTSLRVR